MPRRNAAEYGDTAATKAAIRLLAGRAWIKLSVCGLIVANSLALVGCHQTDNAKVPGGTSIPPAASTTTVRTTPRSPGPGTYASAPVRGDQASAETAIKQGYVKKLADCYATRNSIGIILAVNWKPPGFKESQGGSGVIEDAEPSLGGEFTARYEDGRWNVVYNWC